MRPLLRRLPATLKQRFGAVLLGTVIVAVLVATMRSENPPDPLPNPNNLTIVKGYGGELKFNFLTDPAVKTILAEEYGLQVEIIKRTADDLACGMPLDADDDFVWLGDSVALARYTDRGCTKQSDDYVYNSPVVLYSWAPVADALVTAGVAKVDANGAYTVDFARLVDLIMTGATWSDIGLPQLHGTIVVHTTDPTKSTSGLLFAGMLANSLNNGTIPDPTTVGPLLPEIQAYFLKLGHMEPASGDLFEQFLITGPGAKPIVALYESQIQEFLASYPSYRDEISKEVRMLYPKPTVWATHPFVVRSDNAGRLLTALKDPDIQRLAWERHGQRPGVPGVTIDPAVMPIPGFLAQVTSTNLPGLDVMDRILAEISAQPPNATATPGLSLGVAIAAAMVNWHKTRHAGLPGIQRRGAAIVGHARAGMRVPQRRRYDPHDHP
jgi:hypothetical protein